MNRRPRRRLRGVALCAVAPLLAACGGVGSAASAGPTVVTSIYPLGFVADRIAGEHADVQVLTSPGQEPHDLELTFKQTVDVAEADVVVFSRGLQPVVDAAVDQAVGQAGSHPVVDAAEIADLLPAGESVEEHAGHGEGDDHDDEDVDPHFWLDPQRLGMVAEAVADQLAEADPPHAADYAANLADLQDDLGALDEAFATGLTGCARDTIVVSHDAFGYLAARYGLQVEAINGLTPDAEPSPAHLAALAGLIESDGITTVFAEELGTRDLADTLSLELGLRTAVLDPVEGLSEATAGEDYLSLMRGNLAAIEKANDCS